jgi:hypothetical protein
MFEHRHGVGRQELFGVGEPGTVEQDGYGFKKLTLSNDWTKFS